MFFRDHFFLGSQHKDLPSEGVDWVVLRGLTPPLCANFLFFFLFSALLYQDRSFRDSFVIASVLDVLSKSKYTSSAPKKKNRTKRTSSRFFECFVCFCWFLKKVLENINVFNSLPGKLTKEKYLKNLSFEQDCHFVPQVPWRRKTLFFRFSLL